MMTSGMRLVKTYLNSCSQRCHPREVRQTYLWGELEGRPVVSVLHDVQHITLELDLSVKVGVVELLHGDLGVLVLSQIGALQVDVVIERLAGEGNLLIKSLAVLRAEGPVADSEGHEQDNNEEPVESPSCLEGEEALDQEGDDQIDSGEVVVVERGRAFSWEWGIGDGRVVGAVGELCCEEPSSCQRAINTHVVNAFWVTAVPLGNLPSSCCTEAMMGDVLMKQV